MFSGEFEHTIDPKGRVIVPAVFREELGEKPSVTLGMDGCLYLYPESAVKDLEDRLSKLPDTKDNRKLKRFFLTKMDEAEIDKQGRILIKLKKREFAGLEKDVIFAGMGNKIEIWSKERYEAEDDYDDIEDVFERISDVNGSAFRL